MLDVTYGKSRLLRQHASMVLAAVQTADVSGSLYFGYPVLSSAESRQPLDALLVSPDCGVVGLLLASAPPLVGDAAAWGKLLEEQDGLYGALETQLGRHPSLRTRRKLVVQPEAITLLPTGTPVPEGVEGNFVQIDRLAQFLREQPGIHDTAVFKRVCSVVEHVSTIKPAKRREKVQQQNSMGAKLQRIERHISTLDQWQKQAAIETPDGPQRIRGLAGSGKTVVLALKAAYLHAQSPDWRIAVVFYTQSLYQQFKDLVRRFCFEHLQTEPDWSKIHILHAWGSNYQEGFYSYVADAAKLPARNWASAQAQFGRDKAFEGCCLELLSALVGSGSAPEELFDAVLIDEAQDLPVSFFRLVYAVTTQPKRIVWAYDELQQLSAESVPNASDLFGRDANGAPLVTLAAQDGEAHGDLVLQLCYRNPPWTLTVAHGLGFGTARKSRDLVQHFDDPTLWEDVGYETVAGSLELGRPVKLVRKPDSFPDFFAEEFTEALNDVVSVKCFNSDYEQFNWVAQQINYHLTNSELEHDDFLIVLPNEYTAKSRASYMISALAQHGIRGHNAGVNTARDVVFQDGSIAVAHIYRAKGNEAPFVYVLDADYAEGSYDGPVGLASRRNKLFTAITRSRAWVCICGVGDAMKTIAEEVDKIKASEYVLDFTVPTLAQLASMRRLNRDRTEAEQRRVTKARQSLQQVAAAVASGEISPADLDEKTRRALKRLLGPGSDDEGT